MTDSTPDITAIICGHREGRLCVPSIRSFAAAIAAARTGGLQIEPLAVIDDGDPLTRELFAASLNEMAKIIECRHADQALARNTAIDVATGRYIAFLDGDDLWAQDWLIRSFEYLKDQPPHHIAHPNYNYYFDDRHGIFRMIDQESQEFDIDLLRMTNFWDCLCLCPADIYRSIPFRANDVTRGWEYEDWCWNCDTVSAGMIHKVVPDTVLFKRRRTDSQCTRAAAMGARIRTSPLLHYDNPIYRSV